MQDTKLFETILGMRAPWRIHRLALDTSGERVDLWPDVQKAPNDSEQEVTPKTSTLASAQHCHSPAPSSPSAVSTAPPALTGHLHDGRVREEAIEDRGGGRDVAEEAFFVVFQRFVSSWWAGLSLVGIYLVFSRRRVA